MKMKVLYLGLILSCANLFAMELPEAPKKIVEKSFGQTFNYSSLLNPNNDINSKIYKRRLTFVKRYLFDYINGYTRPFGTETESSGSINKFLKNYLQAVTTLKRTANLMPFFNGQPVGKYIPERALHRSFFTTETPNGKFVTLICDPYYVINDPDAESLALSLTQLSHSNLPFSQKKDVALNLWNQVTQSDQYKRILSCFTFEFMGQYLDNLIEQQKQKLKIAPPIADQIVFDRFRSNCPHILQLESLQERLLACIRNFLDYQLDKSFDFAINEKNLFNELNTYVLEIDSLSKEYEIIYQCIQNELKKLKNTGTTKTIEPMEDAEEEAVEPVVIAHEKPKLAQSKICYSRRILRWFKESFTKNKKDSSILYHTLLPKMADTLVIQYGQRSEYDNKTHKGQKDDHYSIGGKIINDETKEESYCMFNLCLDPKGVCYHRDCKKCTWESLPAELKNGGAVEDEEYEEGIEECDEAKDEKPFIIQESNASAIIYNPIHKCKIVLFKKQL